MDPLAVDLSAAQNLDDRLEGVFGIGIGAAGEQIDVGELVLGPGGDDEVGFGEHEYTCDAVGLEQHGQLAEDRGTQSGHGRAHGIEQLVRFRLGCCAVDEVVGGADHAVAPAQVAAGCPAWVGMVAVGSRPAR